MGGASGVGFLPPATTGGHGPTVPRQGARARRGAGDDAAWEEGAGHGDLVGAASEPPGPF